MMIYTKPAALAELIMAEQTPAPKPDLFDRLVQQEGFGRAKSFWNQACAYNDSNARAQAVASLKAALSATPANLDQAAKDAYAAWQLSHYRLSGLWEDIRNSIAAAGTGIPVDLTLILEDVREADNMESDF